MITPDDVIMIKVNRINDLQQAHRSLNRIISKLESSNCFELFNAIHKEENRAWRDLLLFSLTSTDEMRRKIKMLAYDRFFRENMHVMSIVGNTVTSSYLVSEEQELKEMLKLHFRG
jgi:uncharacterized protein YbcI